MDLLVDGTDGDTSNLPLMVSKILASKTFSSQLVKSILVNVWGIKGNLN